MFSEFLLVSVLYFVAASTSQINDGFVTCGSVVKLKNNDEGEKDKAIEFHKIVDLRM